MAQMSSCKEEAAGGRYNILDYSVVCAVLYGV